MPMLVLSLFIGVLYYVAVRSLKNQWILMLLLFLLPLIFAFYYLFTTLQDFEWILSGVDYNYFYSVLIASPVLIPVMMMTIFAYIWSFIVLFSSYVIAKRIAKKKTVL